MAFLAGPRLLDWASSPPHLQFNKFVLTGYRPASSGSGCLRSLFYMHNELGNIYTHGEPHPAPRTRSSPVRAGAAARRPRRAPAPRSLAVPALARPGATVTKLPLSRTSLPASAAPGAGEGSGVGDPVRLILLSPGKTQLGVRPLRNPCALSSSPASTHLGDGYRRGAQERKSGRAALPLSRGAPPGGGSFLPPLAPGPSSAAPPNRADTGLPVLGLPRQTGG